MGKFLIEPHFRLQDWIAHDKGYFTDEGLDYEFRETVRSSDGKVHDNSGQDVMRLSTASATYRRRAMLLASPQCSMTRT